jgi:CDP-diacylglycerol--serine O-phosphatidyltransferase
MGIAALSAWIMVAEIPMISFKISSKDWRHYKAQMLLIIAAILLLPMLRYSAIPVIVFLYIILSLIFPPNKNQHA